MQELENAEKSNKQAEKNVSENITPKEFLLLTQNGPDGSVLDVKPLWDNFYRLNFWKKFADPNGGVLWRNLIVESRFIELNEDGDSYIVNDLTREQREKSKTT